MPDRHHPRALVLVVVATLAVLGAPFAVTASTPPTAAPADVESPGVTASPTTDPADTAPDTSPETAPDTTIGAGPVDTLVGADPDPEVGDVALVAVVGLVVVLSLAAWWMARRDDDRPVPDPPPSDVL